MTTNASPRRGRKRDPDLTPRLLDAALAEYGRTGWAGFTMDAVARRAGVGKAPLYLRWPSKESLLADAIETRARNLVARDTGSLRGDTLELAASMFEYYLSPEGWATLRIVVDSVMGPPTFAPFHKRIVTMHREGAERMVRRAVERGELADGVVTHAFVQALFGGVLMGVLSLTGDDREHAGTRITDHVTPLVDFVLASVQARAPHPT